MCVWLGIVQSILETTGAAASFKTMLLYGEEEHYAIDSSTINLSGSQKFLNNSAREGGAILRVISIAADSL